MGATQPSWLDRGVAAALSVMVLSTAVGSVVNAADGPAGVLAGALAWLSGLLLMSRVGARQRAAVVALTIVGLLGMVWGAANGHPPEWRLALAANQPLIGMLAAVSFLRIVAAPPATAPRAPPPRGRVGVWQTMLGVHLFGSVINITALDIVGDRFLARGPLDRAHLLLLSRSYSTAAFWSPFWGATAAVMTYAPEARVAILMLVGGLVAAVSIAVSGFTIIRGFGPAIRDFEGYPMSPTSLAVPTTLVALALGTHLVLRDMPIVGLITVCSPALTVIVLAFRDVRSLPRKLADHAVRHLPAMAGELAVFLSAGVLIAGFAPMSRTLGIQSSLSEFTWLHAWGLVGLMACLSLFGLHPVVSFAICASLLAPIDPNPTLFAMAGLIAWGIQSAGGPVSGLNVIMHGRYGTDSFTIARWNVRYVLGVFAVAGPALWLCATLVPMP